jgi:hypothetical protein
MTVQPTSLRLSKPRNVALAWRWPCQPANIQRCEDAILSSTNHLLLFQVFRRDSAMRSAVIVFAHMFEPVEPPPLNKRVRALLALWCTFLPFWLLLSLGAAAFRTNVGGNLFVTSWGFYPVLLLIPSFLSGQGHI